MAVILFSWFSVCFGHSDTEKDQGEFTSRDSIANSNELRDDGPQLRSVVEADVSEQGEFIKVLILPREQTDTAAVANQARQHVERSHLRRTDKLEIRRAVVSALQETAAASQADLLVFLHEQQITGNVNEYKSYFIINVVYASLTEEIIEVIAKRPDVESISYNERIELVSNESSFYDIQSSAIEWNISQIQAPNV